ETKHDYWVNLDSLEGTTPNRKVSVSIEVASIPAVGSVDFYMYYGKVGDSSESNGDNTFEFFDDFEGTSLDAMSTSGDVAVANDPGRYEAWPGIAKDSSGNLFVAYRTCDTNTHGFCSTAKVVIRKSTDNGETWGSEVTVLDTANYDNRLTNSILIFDDNGTETILVTCNKYDDSPHVRVLYAVKSIDDGANWGSPIEICPACSLSHPAGCPILTSQGKILVPACIDKDISWQEAVFESADGGDTWTKHNVTGTNSGRNEFAIIETKTGGSYTGGMYAIFRRNDGTHYDYATSTDYGHTWSALAEETGLPVATQPTPCFLYRLNNGNIVAAYTRVTKRLVVYESSDECTSWTYKKDVITTQSISYYPALTEITSADLIFVWCVNGAASDVYVNFEDYPLVPTKKWRIAQGSVSVSDSVLSLTANPTYVLSTSKVYTQPMILMGRAKFSDDDEQQHFWGTSDNDGSVFNNSLGFLKYSLMRKQVYKNGTATSQNDAHVGLGSYRNYKMWWKTDEAKFYEGGNLTATLTTDVPTVDLYILLRRSGTSVFYFDFVLLRKYVSPEPTWGSWGIEEQNGGESGQGVDAILNSLSSRLEADTGIGADAILNSLSSRLEADTGVGVDALISLLEVIAKYSSDTGVGIYALVDLLAAISSSDTGVGVENQEVSIWQYVLLKLKLLQKKELNMRLSQE
ncbi:MAG: DUF2341 domain-containing protein, partial [Patescibacteria group bacterium]|nr:DUF2341 domain-containing protein [Patescibacteria group bacterium]